MRPPALLALLGLISLLMLPNGIEGGALVHLFHYHKTGHDLILSVMGSLVRGEMAQVVPKWKFSFFQGRHGWTHPSVPMPRRSDHWAFAHHNKSLPLGEFQMQCMTLEHVLRRGNFDPLLADPRPIMLFTSSPDFACPDSATKWGGEELPRIAHFVRDPWSMAVSSFLYHNQKNTPERFVKRLVGPCVCNHRSHIFLSKVLSLPEEYLDLICEHHTQLFLRLQRQWYDAHPGSQEKAKATLVEQRKAFGEDRLAKLKKAQVNPLVTPRRSLSDMEGSYYDLLQMEPKDAVRMEAARMLSQQSEYMCGNGAADILRMVANQHAIKTNFPNSQTFIMSNWTSADVAVKDAAFARLLRVICGESNECSQGGAARLQELAVELRKREDEEMAKPTVHHTGGAGVGKDGQTKSHRAELEQALRKDPVLAPMLEYSNCIIMGGVPGVSCVFDVIKLRRARAYVGRLSSDGMNMKVRKVIKNPHELAVSALIGSNGFLGEEEEEVEQEQEEVEQEQEQERGVDTSHGTMGGKDKDSGHVKPTFSYRGVQF